MAQLVTVRLNKADHQPLGFRLQGGKDFGTPLVVQKVNGGSAAERAGLQAGDALIRVNNTEVFTLRHQEAQDAIRAAGGALELTIQRGGGTWRPSVTPTGSLPRPGRALGGAPTLVTSTSLKANQQQSRAFGSGHNSVAKPFGYMNGGGDAVKSIVNKQYNTPVAMYSDKTIAETLSAQTEVLAGGVLGVNFKKNEKTYDAEKSAVFKMLQEDQNDPEPEVGSPVGGGVPPVSGLRQVTAPVTRPDAPINNTGGLPPGQNICEECERLITGVFVRIKDKNLHVECFKCATCGTSLKNQGYYNLNGKLYCDIHAKLVARQNPPAPHLEPVTVPPGGRLPSNTYSTPLPPLATNNYTNGSSSLFSPSSNFSGPKPFGSSLGSAYSPASLSPRSAPLSPARPVTIPTAAPAPAPVAPFAPTNEVLNASSPHKPEYKSPAEERLIRKMAKMALNGYEIGIQRKIKPADHIQIMADKIQDTVVTKHPLNSDNIPSSDSSREGTLTRSTSGNSERSFKIAENINSIGDKIKDTILSNHPATINYSNGNLTLDSSRENTLTRNKNSDRSLKITDNINNIGDKIKDTIISKHPATVNCTNGNMSSDISRESTLAKSVSKNNDRSLKFTDNNNIVGDKIKNAIISDHPTIINYSNDDIPVPPPPPLPTTPIPTFNTHSTPISNTFSPKKSIDDPTPVSKILFSNTSDDITDNTNVQINGIHDQQNKEMNKNENNYNTLQKIGNMYDKSIESFKDFNDTNKLNNLKFEEKPDSSYSNTMSKRKVFEKRIEDANLHLTNTLPRPYDKFNKNGFGKNSIVEKTNNVYENGKNDSMGKDNNENKTFKDSNLPNSLYDNTLYQFKHENNISTPNKDIVNVLTKDNSTNNTSNIENSNEQNSENEFVVKRRQKKTDRNNDGRRDSHIIARPLSTVKTEDAADGLYPVCHKCDKAITRGPFITALGRIWCPEHFICVNASCRRHLQDIGFVEENGQLYCEFCFEQYIAPACDKCHAKIKGDCLNAIGKHFHPECFNCVYCGKLFGNNPFFLEDGLPYCEADWNELFTTKCFACGFPVEAGDRWVEALNNNYHSQCFNCTVCKKNLEGQSFFAKGGRPFCKIHAR